MSTITTQTEATTRRTDVISIVVGATIGSFAFGIVMALTMGPVLFNAIPAMYGLESAAPVPSVLLGWGIHISHGVVLGLIFGVISHLVGLPESGGLRRWAVAGLVYGVVLWIALASYLMPFWVGLASSLQPPVPSWNPWSLVGHLAYGLWLSLLFAIYRRHE